jgi:hypothetical protein
MPLEPAATSSPPIDRAAVDLRGLAMMLCVSLSSAKTLRTDGKLPSPCLEHGRIIRWSVDEVRAWIVAGCPGRILWNQIKEASIRKFLAARAA